MFTLLAIPSHLRNPSDPSWSLLFPLTLIFFFPVELPLRPTLSVTFILISLSIQYISHSLLPKKIANAALFIHKIRSGCFPKQLARFPSFRPADVSMFLILFFLLFHPSLERLWSADKRSLNCPRASFLSFPDFVTE